VADEFAAVIGLPGQVTQFDAAGGYMRLDASGGQIERLGPVMGNIVQILGVGRDLLKERPLGFDGGQVMPGLVFLAGVPFDANLRRPTGSFG
jgi:hypothetical protein